MKKSMIAALFGMAVVVLTADHALAGRGGGGGSRGGSGAMRGQSAMRGQMNGQQQMYQQRMQQQQAYQQQAYQQQMRNRYRYGSQGGQFMQQGGQPLLGDQNNTVQQQTIMQQQSVARSNSGFEMVQGQGKDVQRGLVLKIRRECRIVRGLAKVATLQFRQGSGSSNSFRIAPQDKRRPRLPKLRELSAWHLVWVLFLGKKGDTGYEKPIDCVGPLGDSYLGSCGAC